MAGYHFRDGITVQGKALVERCAPFAHKLAWFHEKGYDPHYYQLLFHTARNAEDRLTRFRHLVAGRRGGKTLSAAWELLYYAQHPEQFHLDAYGSESTDELWCWVLTKDHVVGRAALLTFRSVLKKAGLVHGKDYTENRGLKFFEFPDKCLIEFKTADDPQSLRGAGLDLLWMDEAAFIASREAWDVVRPALSDKQGLLMTTTTPYDKSWLHPEFWSEKALADDDQMRVEFTSLHNPHFPEKEWKIAQENYHPILFAREYMASWDAMMGLELPGDWLKYYELHDLPKTAGGRWDLRTYMGVDPAISLADTADRFSMALLGVSKDGIVYLLEQYAGRVPFAEQIDLIAEWHLKYKPQMIGIESTAYQVALAQQVQRMSTLPPVVPMLAKGKKAERILSMSPLFKIGKILIRKDHRDFIEEWITYDSSKSNPNDDCLDAVEIALRTAGALMADLIPVKQTFASDATTQAAWDRQTTGFRPKTAYDEIMGSEW